MDNLMLIEFAESLCGKDYGDVKRFALYNAKVITEDEVVQYIKDGTAYYSDKIVILTEEQYKNLCIKE